MAKAVDVPAFTMNQLAVFVAVAEAGTISAAAERMHVSPSAVSAAITELERALRADLVHRQRAKGARLTPTGEQVLARARALLHQASELAADARGEGVRRGLTGTIRLGSYLSLGPSVLPGLVSTFLDTHPEVDIEISESTQDQLTAALEDGRLDLALMYDVHISPALRSVPVTRWTPTVTLPAGHRLAGGRPIRLTELKEEPLVLIQAPPSDEWILARCADAGFEPVIRYRVRSYETARSLVARGFGWTMQIQRPRNTTSYEGLEIVSVEVAEPRVEPVAVLLAAARDSMLNRAARTFVTHATTLEEHPAGFVR
ncbi:LysR family transcriptional regulator [Nocardioides sp. TF02-7]|uniref:LysR family transcriptional regulator n=1 Tax=Nocardioides sp. TF02-7 TaxID=2917724 RepID=UPI001F056958|nr:LysR family transcriptional regulator [Nocardioides sp. TF02-7]UMG91674.1 LysR family transcriptional regulator [Nocardioides sp. TF02-7]